MSVNVEVGAIAVYVTTAQASSSQIVNFASGQIQGTTTWTRLFVSADNGCTLRRTGNTLDLKTLEKGTLEQAIIDPDVWSLEVPIADISIANFKQFLLINPDYATSSGTIIPFQQSYVGYNMMNYGVSYAIVHKAYAYSSDDNLLPLTDPNAWAFVNGIPDRNMEFAYDPRAQQLMNFSVKFSALQSSSGTVAFGLMGTLDTTS